MEITIARRSSVEDFLARLTGQLDAHKGRIISDPQANPVKLLAYDISKDVEDRTVAFRDIEGLIKAISDERLIARARRLRRRAGVTDVSAHDAAITAMCETKAKDGFEAFKTWAENAGQGIVLTAHPTFSLSRDIRETLGEIASRDDGAFDDQTEHLKTLPYLPKRAPTLQEEHVDTQDALARIQAALSAVNAAVLDAAKRLFPKQWTELTPCLAKAYSWVGYDIDGRTDISWGDALRLRLSEKSVQVQRYQMAAKIIKSAHDFDTDGTKAVDALVTKLSNGYESAERDLTLFNKDLTDTDNLVAAANNLTRTSDRRLRSTATLYPLIATAVAGAKTDAAKKQLILLRSDLRTFGLGTARIHFRLNARHVTNAMRHEFGLTEDSTDNRTVLLRASKLTQDVTPQPVNFASLALEKSTAHQQMILTAQIHKYIDDETPIRLLIAECEDSLTPLGMLYLARRYGLEKHLDISPLFETASALNNGGRIIDKMLSNPVYRNYIEQRGTFAIQTGFSDAGRFMGQIPATLAIERLQSHFANALAKHNVKDVTAIVFNTHGEGAGRGGHPGTVIDRVNYAMSPWAVTQFEKRALPLCHETSFQGGDGFLWFQTDALARATVNNLVAARWADRTAAEDDIFYTESDFSWDVFRTIGSEQDSLYNDPNYVTLLGGFGQNLLIPTGSRAAQRAKTASDMFNPRQLRAIPHNAILQQFGVPANIFYGVGKATAIDPEKFTALFKTSARAQSIFGLVIESMQRSNISILTAYGRVLDPNFWVSRSLSGNEPRLAKRSREVAKTLTALPWRSQLMDLANRLRLDVFDSLDFFCTYDRCLSFENDDQLVILHALRLAVIMKMLIIATDLPAIGPEGTSQLNVLQKLQTLQMDSIISDLHRRYPETREALKWTEKLTEKTDVPVAPAGGFPHITETVIKPLDRASQLVRQVTIAITHGYDAYG